ncbi:hypothetical protein C9I57_24875 [Trinickia symbiotica]|uniref:Uncharacterized protein n=1 Tax=Trinickia symbiotica TaxID=863227 RepID=A0A2T3XNK2_9BURK|nr:hypothetical protein C9I57_24875 [Trinickia symbiotica]
MSRIGRGTHRVFRLRFADGTDEQAYPLRGSPPISHSAKLPRTADPLFFLPRHGETDPNRAGANAKRGASE